MKVGEIESRRYKSEEETRVAHTVNLGKKSAGSVGGPPFTPPFLVTLFTRTQ